MSRPLRIELRMHLYCIEQASLRFNIEVHSYCFMANYHHLLIKIPESKLVFMGSILSAHKNKKPLQ